MQTNNLETLKIHRLTKEQYEREKAADRLDPAALYLTEAEPVSSVTIKRWEETD